MGRKWQYNYYLFANYLLFIGYKGFSFPNSIGNKSAALIP